MFYKGELFSELSCRDLVEAVGIDLRWLFQEKILEVRVFGFSCQRSMKKAQTVTYEQSRDHNCQSCINVNILLSNVTQEVTQQHKYCHAIII